MATGVQVVLMKKLIKGDDLKLQYPTNKTYTKEKDLSEIGGSTADWTAISRIKHLWIGINDRNWEGPLIKITGTKARYNPLVIKDYLEKMGR